MVRLVIHCLIEIIQLKQSTAVVHNDVMSLGGKTSICSALRCLKVRGAGFLCLAGRVVGWHSSLPTRHCWKSRTAHSGVLVSASSSKPPKWESSSTKCCCHFLPQNHRVISLLVLGGQEPKWTSSADVFLKGEEMITADLEFFSKIAFCPFL